MVRKPFVILRNVTHGRKAHSQPLFVASSEVLDKQVADDDDDDPLPANEPTDYDPDDIPF